MLTAITCLLLGASVPEVVSGPALLERAKSVDLPIKNVTVFSDRAQMERSGTVALASGVQAVRLPDLPGAALTNTVRLAVEKASLLRLEVRPVLRERLSIDALDEVLTEIETLQDEANGLNRQLGIYKGEMTLLAGLLPKGAPSEEARLTAKAPALLAPGAWQTVLGFLESRRAQNAATVAGLVVKQRAVFEKLSVALGKAERLEGEGLSDRRL
jgi:hypothetical protein